MPTDKTGLKIPSGMNTSLINAPRIDTMGINSMGAASPSSLFVPLAAISPGQIGQWLMSLLPVHTLQAPKPLLSWPIVIAIILLMVGTATALLYQDYQSISASGGMDHQAVLAVWESKRNVAVALVGALIALFVGAVFVLQKHTANAVALATLATRNHAEAMARSHADELSKRKSEFLSQMSHELRTPLNAIIGFSEVIKEASFGPVGQPKYQEYADDIHYSAQHLLSVINNILDLSKVESGKWQIGDDDVALCDLFDALLRLATERASRENVCLSVKSVVEGIIIRGDKRTLLQIMLNLTVNAIKFAGPDRLVDLDVRSMTDGGIEISVADYGDGMTQDDLKRAMRPFDAPASHMNRKKQDTGLGLPLAAAFAELHGGEVVLDSEPGNGTIARLRLPASRIRLASLPISVG